MPALLEGWGSGHNLLVLCDTCYHVSGERQTGIAEGTVVREELG